MPVLPLLLTALSAILTSSSTQTWTRNQSQAITLQSGSGNYWGLDDRKADHAAVAMNSVGDVLVAFHSSRPDFNPTSYPNLKQVEVALLEYNSSSDSWTLSAQNQAVVGGVDPTPLNQFYSQSDVKCERPDVIAVGEWFCVAWTRIYDRDYDGGAPYGTTADQTKEPADLECAWIRKVNGVMQVYTGNATPGQGMILDADSGNRSAPASGSASAPAARTW